MKERVRRIIVWVLTLEARAIIRRYKPKIILVTGSVGKTTTKDAVYSALATHTFVRKSEKSFNSDVGAPLTILGVPSGWSNPLQWIRNILDGLILLLIRAPYPEWLVVEVGADRPGDITKSLAWLKPLVVIATRFPAVPVHVEFYESPEEVMHEEIAPVYWLRPGGTFVGNADDEAVRSVQPPDGVERLLYGLSKDADIRGSRIRTLTERGVPRGMSFDVATVRGERAHAVLEGVVGTAHVYAALAGVACAVSLGVPLPAAVASLETHKSPPGRMKLIKGMSGAVLIDDTYNASPIAVEEALKTLALLPHKGRRIAVLGDMLELGAYSVTEHEKAGALATQSCDMLVTVGMRARKFASGAESAGMPQENILQFDRALDAGEHLKSVVGEGDVILLKGSQGVRMERATKVLMAEPDSAKELLPRQDAEWLTR